MIAAWHAAVVTSRRRSPLESDAAALACAASPMSSRNRACPGAYRRRWTPEQRGTHYGHEAYEGGQHRVLDEVLTLVLPDEPSQQISHESVLLVLTSHAHRSSLESRPNPSDRAGRVIGTGSRSNAPTGELCRTDRLLTCAQDEGWPGQAPKTADVPPAEYGAA